MFYVSCKDGDRYSLLAGPSVTHREALDAVDEARELAYEIDPFSWFYAFGTCKMPPGYDEPGVLNDLMKGEDSGI